MAIYIIGIGSQRAGSTLLYKILDKCSTIFMHPVKELHYYDTLFNVRHENFLKEFSKKQLLNLSGTTPKSKREQCLFRTNEILCEKPIIEVNYHDLYRPCIMGNEYLCEITPEYMILPTKGIKKMYEDLGSNTKIILIARNPVQRFISAVKLLKIYNNKPFNMEFFEQELLRVIREMPDWVKSQDALNDYEEALKKYQKYFSNILFISYDQIVKSVDSTHQNLEDFLNVKVDKRQYRKILENKVNTLAETGYISEKTKIILNKKYEKEIDFLNGKFGINSCVM